MSSLSNCGLYNTRKCKILCLDTGDDCTTILSFLCQKEQSDSKELTCKMWLYLKNKRLHYFLIVSHRSSPRPALEAMAKVLDFLSELLPQVPSTLKLSSWYLEFLHIPTPNPTLSSYTHTTSHYFISFQTFNMSLTVSHLLIALLDSEGIMGINGLCNKKLSWAITC